MPRQRLRQRSSGFARFFGRLLVVLFAAALIVYGAALVSLAFKVAPDDVDAFTGYRTAYDWLAGLSEGDLTTVVRAIVAGAGLVVCLLFAWLAIRSVPRPYRVRHDVELSRDALGRVTVAARAIERVAESAAREHPAVAGAGGRFETDSLALGVGLRQAGELPETLRDVQRRVSEALERHGLPVVPVHLTLTGVERRTRRDLE